MSLYSFIKAQWVGLGKPGLVSLMMSPHHKVTLKKVVWGQTGGTRSEQGEWLAGQSRPSALFSERCLCVRCQCVSVLQVWLNGNGQEQGQGY